MDICKLFLFLCYPIKKKTYLAAIYPFIQVLAAACGIQLPDQGLNPGPLHWERGVLTTGPPRKSL